VFCYDVDDLMNALGIKHDVQVRRLFIESTNLSLKTVLLRNGNQQPSIPVGHTVHKKTNLRKSKQLLNKHDYSKHGCYICGDLKVASLLLGLEHGYSKYCCFLCEWGSRAKIFHYLKRGWPQGKTLKVGDKNVQHPALAE